jgi:hypothetical protein
MPSKALYRFVIISILAALTSCTLTRLVIYNYDDLNDYRKFLSRALTSDSLIFTFQKAENMIAPSGYESDSAGDLSFEDFLETRETVAFLIIKNDTIVYENYFRDYEKTSIVPAFSMVKSILSILTGCAIDEGLIKSADEPVTKCAIARVCPGKSIKRKICHAIHAGKIMATPGNGV